MTAMLQLLTDLHVATMAHGDAPYGMIRDAAIAIQDGKIAWVGPQTDVPADFAGLDQRSLGGRVVTPGLIDCHTHIVHGGDRAVEFEMRLNGASYEEVARAGGGIVSTVTATRAASEDELLAQALRRVDVLIAEGVTTIEIKSGYGLDTETELRMLRVARMIADQRPIRVKTTFLGAHATPAEYAGRDDDYIDEVCIPALRAAHADVFDVARDLGLPVKLHAEQLSNLGGAKLAASYGALSADHIEYLDEPGVRAMADAGTGMGCRLRSRRI